MSLLDFAVRAMWCAAAVLVALVLAVLGRRLAVLARQPAVVGEIAFGLSLGPVLAWVGGPGFTARVLPPDVLRGVAFVGHVGLVLFLVAVAHHLRVGPVSIPARRLGAVVVGSVVVSLATGVAAAWWVIAAGGPALRGPAPAAAFVLFMAVSLVVTAVPVLARLLDDRGIGDTRAGKVAMTTALVTDVLAWVLLAVAIGLAAGGGWISVLVRVLLIGVCVVVTLPVRALLARTSPAGARRWPVLLAAAVALVVGLSLEHAGLTVVLGAVVVGLSLPVTDAWTALVRSLERWGRALLPVFFLASGVTVFAAPLGTAPWSAIAVMTALAVVGKVGGGYVGARAAGLPPRTAGEVGVLLNTRGLTEVVVLQVGYSIGLLTAPLYLALLVMALVTTAMTGPLHALLVRRAGRLEPEGARA